MRGVGGRKRVEDLKKNKVVVEVVAGEEKEVENDIKKSLLPLFASNCPPSPIVEDIPELETPGPIISGYFIVALFCYIYSF
jgi:hypothetical protein